ncbi:alpha/beta fold hydrolase [Robertkochia sediminum]|uniref:alpha/beta fold hydrolase n=1 Tax=Robertkochia sediminum TaxID=2785326 RepID=UPI001931D8A4|nr:alpha/beta fold hydrolase [Robertkochia sediminum]MBL7472406.1 alpha/beta fold hydrolase [Robertkochia sediminum]
MTDQLYSKILGEGAPLLILHGFLGMSDNWKTLGAEYAKNGYQVHLIDQRNHGRSFHAETFNYPTLSDDLARYADQHQLEDFNIIGHSMGGKTAMTFACDHPERTAKLLVADIAPRYYAPHHQEIINGLKAIDLRAVRSRGDADRMLAEHLSIPGIRQFLLKNLYRKQPDQFAFRFNLDVLANRLEEIGEPLEADNTYNGDTLFLSGAKSDYIREEDTPLIRTHFPNAQIREIANAGHWLHAENPAAFLEESLDFFKH